MSNPQSRWYPSREQLNTPEKLEQVFREVLRLHYAVSDKADATSSATPAHPATSSSGFPPGSGPADTILLGLRVAPVDTTSLANGATLKFDKKNGNFKFS